MGTTNQSKSAKRLLAEMCLYGNKEFVLSHELSMMSDMSAYVDGEKENLKAYELPKGADVEYPIKPDSKSEMIPISNLRSVGSVDDHMVMNFDSHLIATIDIRSELKALEEEDRELKMKDPESWQAKRDAYVNPSDRELKRIIGQHFAEPTIEKALAQKCISSQKEPLTMRAGVYLIINHGTRKERTLDIDDMADFKFKPGMHLTVSDGSKETYIGVLDDFDNTDGVVVLETRALMKIEKKNLGLPNGHVISTMDFAPEYNRLLREKVQEYGFDGVALAAKLSPVDLSDLDDLDALDPDFVDDEDLELDL